MTGSCLAQIVGEGIGIGWCYFTHYYFLISHLKWASRSRTDSLLGERRRWLEPRSGQALGVTAKGAKIEVGSELLTLGTQKDEAATNREEQLTKEAALGSG